MDENFYGKHKYENTNTKNGLRIYDSCSAFEFSFEMLDDRNMLFLLFGSS